MKKRNKLGSLVLAFVFVLVALVPAEAHASGNESGWVELLEYSSVNGNGANTFTMGGKTGSFTIPLVTNTMLARVDILIWHQSGEPVVTAKVGSMALTVTRVNTYVSRVYGMIPNGYYKNLTVTFTKAAATSVMWEVLSCRYTPLSIINSTATGEIWVDGDSSNRIACPGDYASDGGGTDMTIPIQIPVVVTDWQKYDSVTIQGSMAGIGLNSVRASIGALGLPYEITYTSSVPSGTAENYRESVSMTHYDTSDTYYGYITGAYDTNNIYLGKTLFTVTIDLTGVNRQDANTLTVWFTGVTYDAYAHMFNVQGLTGGIVVADTSNVSWWTRFTNFMQELMGGDTAEDEQFQADAQDKTDELGDLNDQLENVTKPDPDQIDTDLDSFVSDDDLTAVADGFSDLTSDSLFSTILIMSLSVALLGYILYGKR